MDSAIDEVHEPRVGGVHRLRRLLGAKQAMELSDGRLTLDARTCWVDAWAFERAHQEAVKVGKQAGCREPAVALLEKAIAFYTGTFLREEENETWTVQCRERLRGKFQADVEQLGEYLEYGGNTKEAAALYRRAIDKEPLIESFYQRLIKILGQSDRRADATLVYERCRKVLFAGLGREPSNETQAVHLAINR